jgi:hypothetical protein
MNCPARGYYENVLRRFVPGPKKALEIGTLVHLAFEKILRGEDWRDHCETYIAEQELVLADGGPQIIKEFYWLAPALDSWVVPDDWEIIAIEKELRLEVGRHTIVGRLDSIVGWNDLRWHLQHKSAAGNKNVNNYSEQQRTDWHELVYQRMAEEAGYGPMGGTILNVVRKLTEKSILKSPASAISTHYLARSKALIDTALDDLEYVIDQMEAGAKGDIPLVQNRTACFGFGMCPYKRVCDQTMEITDDDVFFTEKARYEEK